MSRSGLTIWTRPETTTPSNSSSQSYVASACGNISADQLLSAYKGVPAILQLTQDGHGVLVRAAQRLRPALGVEVEDLRPLRVVHLSLVHGLGPRVARVALQVPGVVEDIGEEGLHLGLAAGHDLAQQIAGIPVHEDPAQIEDDGVHAP